MTPATRTVVPARLRAAGPELAVLAVLALGFAGAVVVAPDAFGVLLVVGVVGLVAVAAGLASPVVATSYLLVAAFLRLAVPTGPLPTDPFVLAYGGVLLAVGLWWRTRGGPVPPLRGLGLLVAAYVGWNVLSMVLPHTYDAVYPTYGGEIEVWRFVLIGTVMPLTMLLVGVACLGRERAVRTLVVLLMGIGGYSALVSILQFHGPAALVWPSYALGHPEWPGRAVGVVYQPVVHGLVLVLGYLASVLVASRTAVRGGVRVAAAVVAAACAYGVLLTYTRSAWLCLAVVVLLGAVVARGWRTGFVLTLAAGAVGVAVNWSTFTSDDRSAGGVTSSNELLDRLNINATAIWATGERPLLGWGIGRFPSVNTYHHRQLTPEVPWERGYGLAAHFDLLGISAELGLVGAALWLGVVGLVAARLVHAVRRTPPQSDDVPGGAAGDVGGRDYATLALLALVSWLVTGATVDQRLFDVTNLMVMTLAGSAIGHCWWRRRSAGARQEGAGPEQEGRGPATREPGTAPAAATVAG